MGRRGPGGRRTGARAAVRAAGVAACAAALLVSACGGSDSAEVDTVVRDPDDQQVLTPAEVVEMREGTGDGGEAGAGGATGDTIPLEEVDPTQRLFTAFSEFNGCMEDGGQTFRGDPRSDPTLLEDKEYMDVIQRCAARSDILGALEALQEFNASLTPEEVEERNEQFLQFEECLEERGWTVEASPNESGLLTPSQFESPDGTLNERDLRQCGSEVDPG